METSLHVTWNQSTALDLVLQYMVEVKSATGDWKLVNETILGTSVLVSELNSFTAYSFRVRAKNGLGTSPYSQPSQNVTTLEGGMQDILVKTLYETAAEMKICELSKSMDLTKWGENWKQKAKNAFKLQEIVHRDEIFFSLKWITNEKESGAELTFAKTSGTVTEDREKIDQ